jgi:hypothetical protein
MPRPDAPAANRRRWARAGGLAVVFALGAPAGASAQLDRSCTVSALNRTAPVQADGSWVLPNVPSTVGRLRVRATCVDASATRSGQSDFFDLPTNGIVRVADIRFDLVEPVPATLTLTAPVTTLGAPGETLQLAAVVTLPDGSLIDVTPGATGTNYTTSNPRIATVSPDGRVTAVVSGTVLVSASNEGTLGVVRLQVLLSGDSDGDGIPDDFEVAAGLDPNNPADALGDPDADGLATGAEFPLGLDPFDPDSDDDGLLDGEEVGTTLTDPLLFDTDGDRVGDGLELTAGSDPLDPFSVNLAPILAALEIDPEGFTIVFNTLLGEGSRRVTVTATLIDGTVLDAAGGPYGTTYASSNLAVASFGAEPGRVFAGANGSAAITATNGALSAVTEVHVESFAPTALGFLPLPGAANAIALDGDHAYVAVGGAGLAVADVADPAAPTLDAVLRLPGDGFDVAVGAGYAYLAAGRGGLVTVDVFDPFVPAVVHAAPTPRPALGVAVAGGRAYLVDGSSLWIYDLGDPAAPALVGGVGLPGRPRGVDVAGDLAVVAAEGAGVHVVDVSDAAAPVLVGSTHTRGGSSKAADLVVRGRRAWVADGAFSLGGVKVVDYSVPTTPVVVGQSGDSFGLSSIAAEGEFVFGADYFFANGVPIFNVAADQPIFAATLDFARAPSFRDDNGMGVAVRDQLVYLVGDRWNLYRFGVTGNSALHIGRYARLEEINNVPRPPSVAITTPADGAEFRERRVVRIRADASDDVRVTRVTFLVDGAPVATDFAAAYLHDLVIPDGVTELTLEAEAEDLAGNRTLSEPVRIVVLPDSDPAVRLLAPVPGTVAEGGRTLTIAAEASDDVAVARVELRVDGVPVSVRDSPPYRAEVTVPASGPDLVVTAFAVDNVEQTATSEAVTVPIVPDPPPVVVVLEPEDGDQAIEGGVVRMRVGATDNGGVTEVRYLIDGAEAAVDFDEPFDFAFRAPAGVTELRLAARAFDSLGQSTDSEEMVLSVVPDPGTTMEGRVIAPDGTPVPVAAVTCQTETAVTDSAGRFSIPGVPTVQGRIACSASGSLGGRALAGASAAVPPEIGGVTELGDIVVSPQLLYLADGEEDGFGPPGRLLLFDDTLGRVLPWSQRFEPSGLTGLAATPDGALYATTIEPGALEARAPAAAPAPGRRTAPGIFGGSAVGRLLRLDPETGDPLDDLGEVTFEWDGESFGLAILDLTFDPVSGLLYGIGEVGGEDAIFAIDPATAQSTVLPLGFSFQSVGLAMGEDGFLYLLATGFGSGGEVLRAGPQRSVTAIPRAGTDVFETSLFQIDPVGAEVLDERLVGQIDEVMGLAAVPGAAALLVVTRSDLLVLDLVTLDLTPAVSPTGPIEGALQDAAFRSVHNPATTTIVVGTVLEDDGTPVSGAVVDYPGVTGLSGPDGGFVLADVAVRSDLVRVVVAAGEPAFSAPVPPVAGGVTDVGEVRLEPPGCVQGFLLYSAHCLGGPVTAPLELSVLTGVEGESEEWTPVGTVQPDAGGRFCATLQRRRFYRLREEDVLCTCGGVAVCETFLELFGDEAAGRCTDADPDCREEGTLELFCDFFCGS